MNQYILILIPINPSHWSLKLCQNVNGRQNHQLLSTQNLYLTYLNILGKGKDPSWWLWLFYRDDKLWCHLLQEEPLYNDLSDSSRTQEAYPQKSIQKEKKILFSSLERKQRKDKNPSHLPYITRERATQYLLGTHNKSLTLIMLLYVLSDLTLFYFSFKLYNRGNLSHCNFSEHAGFEYQNWKWNSNWLSTLFSLMPPTIVT